jgi:hypothetical protein
MAKIKTTTEIELDLDSHEIARLFWDLDSDEQAEFFAELKRISEGNLFKQMLWALENIDTNAYLCLEDIAGAFQQLKEVEEAQAVEAQINEAEREEGPK